MSTFSLLAVVISATALLAWANERFLRLPQTIGVMAAALIVSIALTALGALGLGIDEVAESMLHEVDFGKVLMNGMLSFLLFAGALHVDLGDLLERRWSILSLATIGVVISTFLVATAFWGLCQLLGWPIPYGHALLFGALISPTDPIAVLGILRRAGAPRQLRTMIIGESLFNDGVGVVVFLMIVGFVAGGHELSAPAVVELFAVEALGGAAFGLVLGWIAYRLLRGVNQYTTEILITLALVAGGYAAAGALHTSGPIAMVVAGLFIGNHGRAFGMSDETREHVDTFWELIDEVLNAVLFVLIGFEMLVLDLEPVYLLLGVASIPIVLLMRFLAVSVPINALRVIRSFGPRTVSLLTWGGIRGGISIALALSVPAEASRELILVATYVVVIFSILVQGLTVGRAVSWVASRTAAVE